MDALAPVNLMAIGLTALSAGTLAFIGGLLAFRVKYAEEITLRPTFEQTKELIGEVAVTLEKIHVDMKESLAEIKADNKEAQNALVARIEKHGDKINEAISAGNRALLIAESLDKEMLRHKKASGARMGKVYNKLNLMDETNGEED